MEAYLAGTASRARRFVAVTLDSWIPCLVYEFGSMLGLFPVVSHPTIEDIVRLRVLGVLLFLVINGLPLHAHSQTVGKALAGIRIVDLESNRVPFSNLLIIRYGIPLSVSSIPVFGKTLLLADTPFGLRADCRCLHDHLAGTVVIRD